MKKRAFTLTELLVVVVIIGVLSAVVLPKFTKVIETRKTTEAENILAAVRSEQEARCTLDKLYTTDATQLAAMPKNLGSNYDYQLNKEGMSAQRQDLNKQYTLQILSYSDGRVCCSGSYCEQLGKKYPKCDELANVRYDSSCVEDGPNPCDKETKTLTCKEAGYPEGYVGSVVQTVNEETCTYNEPVDTCKPGGSCDESYKQDCEELGHSSLAGVWTQGTWNPNGTGNCCQCPHGYHYEDDVGCIKESGCDESYKQDCEMGGQSAERWNFWKPGTWNPNGSGNCCECGDDGYHFEPDAGCVKGECDESYKQDCEMGGQAAERWGAWIAGTWDPNGTGNCCQCPSGYHFEDGAGCVKEDACEDDAQCREECAKKGGKVWTANNGENRVRAPGFWDNKSCECKCASAYGVYADTPCTCYRVIRCDNAKCTQDRCELTSPNWKLCDNGLYSWGKCSNPLYNYRGTGQQYTRGTFARGQWDADTCNCNCPRGSHFAPALCQCVAESGEDVDYHEYYDDDYMEQDEGHESGWFHEYWGADDGYEDDSAYEFEWDY